MSGSQASAATRVELHPGAPGEKASEIAGVFVNGKEAFVHHALVMAEIEKHKDKLWSHKHPAAGERAAFTIFDFEGGQVEVKVQLAKPCKSAAVHPLSAGIRATVSGDVVTFTLDKPRKVTLRVDGQWTDAIHFFCSKPEKDAPKQGDPNVVYFGPGVHRIRSLKLKSDETLYLAPGALVMAELAPDEPMKYSERLKLSVPIGGWLVEAQNAKNIRVRGRGILDASAIPHVGKPSIRFTNCQNVSVEGITITDSSNWNVTFTNCEDASATDVKIISARLNSDGINCVGSRRVRIRDCFVRNRDDTFAVKTMNPAQTAEDIVVEDCVIWNDWGFAVGVTYETRAAIRDITWRNIDVLHCEHWAMGVHVVDSATIENIRFENIRVEHANAAIFRADVTSNMWGTDPERGHIRNVTVENVSFTGPNPPGSIIGGADAQHRVENLTFRKLTVNGKAVTKPDDAGFKINEHTANIRFEP